MVAALSASAQSLEKDEGLKSIELKDIKAHMEFLSSDLMEGRLATEKSSHIVAGYLANMFTFAGLKPIGDVEDADGNTTYYHAVPFVNISEGENMAIRTTSGNITNSYTTGDDFVMTKSVLADLSLSGDVVFVGYGITEEKGFEELAGVDLKGKVVVRLGGFPGSCDPSSDLYKEYEPKYDAMNRLTRKRVREAGAAALLTVTDLKDKDAMPKFYRDDKMTRYAVTHEYDLAYKIGLVSTVEGDISANLAADLCPNIDFKAVRSAGKPSKATATGRSVEIDYDVNYVHHKGLNVMGLLEGKETSRSIVVGGHYDHVGIEDGFVFNGADDNASGVAAVLSIIKAYTDNNITPECNIIFACWGVEEECMLGSEQYVYDNDENCQTVTSVVNFDMIARDLADDPAKNRLELTYSEFCPNYLTMAKDNIKEFGLNVEIVENPVPKYQRGDTDFDSFSQKHGIPFTSYFTHLHDDYHSITDDMSRVNMEKCTEIIKLGFLNVVDLTKSSK